MPEHLKAEVEPLLTLMQPLNERIAALNTTLEQGAQQDEAVANLCTTPHVGPVTASAFVAAVDTPERFDNAHQVESYFGLVPSEMSSGEKQRKPPMRRRHGPPPASANRRTRKPRGASSNSAVPCSRSRRGYTPAPR